MNDRAPLLPKDEMITAIGADGELYPIDKLEAHVEDINHLAVSVFVFHRDRLLMQQRADCKYHSGGLWANTCCSHPRWNESLRACAERRVYEELNVQFSLAPFGVIEYRAPVGKLFENERAYCFAGFTKSDHLPPSPNPMEVQETRWMTLDELDAAIAERPERFSPWIRIYMHEHRALIEKASRSPSALSGA